MKPLIYTNTALISTGSLLLRFMTGLILFVAGAGKVMGWFGGFGIDTTVEIFKSNMNISAFWAYVSSYTEFIGGFLLIIGLLTRLASFAIFINMLVAVIIVGTKNFFMGGAAYPCLLMICALFFLLAGPMALSLDALFSRKKNEPAVTIE